MRALLMSNSTNAGGRLLGHCQEPLRELLRDVARLVFVPFALADHDGYTEEVRQALSGLVDVVGAHTLSLAEIETAPAYFVGGGNTFRLLKHLQDDGSADIIRARVARGAPYIGASAGTCIAGPSMRTTNDMPIVEPKTLTALGLLPFHLNCHYSDTPAGPRQFMGETRDERLEQFLEDNDSVVVGLREGAWLDVDGGTIRVGGRHGGKIFRRSCAPQELPEEGELRAGLVRSRPWPYDSLK
jgi:dipeptidase E